MADETGAGAPGLGSEIEDCWFILSAAERILQRLKAPEGKQADLLGRAFCRARDARQALERITNLRGAETKQETQSADQTS